MQNSASAHDRVRAESRAVPSIRCNNEDLLVSEVSGTIVLFYEHTLDADILVRSLGRTMVDFPHFDVRPVRRGEDLLLEPGEGVGFSVVSDSETLAGALRGFDAPERERLAAIVDPEGALEQGEPSFTARVTQFAGGGSALGLSWHHAIGDWQTFLVFLRAWSRRATGREPELPTIVADRVAWFEEVLRGVHGPTTLRLLSDGEAAEYAAYLREQAQDRCMFSAFFDGAELESMRVALQAEVEDKLSINDALVAHMFSLVAGYDPEPRDRTLAVAVNARPAFRVPHTVAANFSGSVNLACEVGEGAAEIAARLRRGLRAYAERHVDFLANERFVAAHGGRANLERMVSAAVDPLRGNLLVSNWSGVGISAIDFGVGGPLYKAALGVVPIPWMSGIQEGFFGEGWVFTSSLPRTIVERLTSASGQAALHRHRIEDRRPEGMRELPWLW